MAGIDGSAALPALHGLVLGQAQARRLARWARAAAPREACGLLLGHRATHPRARAGRPRVERVTRGRNRAPALALDRFVLDAGDHLRALGTAERLGLTVLGSWHSHPGRPARPSARDRELLADGAFLLLVTLAPGGRAGIRAWVACASEPCELPLLPGACGTAHAGRTA